MECRYARRSPDFPKKHSVRVEQLLRAYLKGLWDYCVISITVSKEGMGMSLEQVLQSKFHVVIGVPANWRLGTKLSVIEAAMAVGFPGKHPASVVDTYVEPAAAAIALMQESPNIGEMNLTVSLTIHVPVPQGHRLMLQIARRHVHGP
jgi:hypothetical protein